MSDDLDENVLASIRIRVHVVTPERSLQLRQEMLPQLPEPESDEPTIFLDRIPIERIIVGICIVAASCALLTSNSFLGEMLGVAVLIAGGWWVLRSPRFALPNNKTQKKD